MSRTQLLRVTGLPTNINASLQLAWSNSFKGELQEHVPRPQGTGFPVGSAFPSQAFGGQSPRTAQSGINSPRSLGGPLVLAWTRDCGTRKGGLPTIKTLDWGLLFCVSSRPTEDPDRVFAAPQACSSPGAPHALSECLSNT